MHCISYTVYHMSFMHPKSKKVCGACFSVSTKLWKKVRKSQGEMWPFVEKNTFLFNFCNKMIYRFHIVYPIPCILPYIVFPVPFLYILRLPI